MMFKKIIIILILLLAFFLRFYKLGTYPALNADEAAIGYNAYSLLETGKDEHGNPWPIHFQSFNDYKPGLYFYLVLPFVKFLGLNEWAVRIPNAFLGVLTVYVLYLLIKELKIKNSLDILAPAMLAISPWHLQFSRGGWEVNTATFFIVLGVLFFFKGLNNIVYLFLSILVFSLSLYTYHAARVIVPLLSFGLLCINFNAVKRNIKNFILAGLLFLVAVLPLIKDITVLEVSSRVAGVGLFADQGPLSRINEQRGEHEDFSGIKTKLLHNKPINYTLAFLENWSDHYHGLFLFLSGDDIERNKVPETGQMYMFDIIFVLAGLWWMAKNINKENRLVFHWLMVAPIAAALTFQSPHALRSQNMVIPLVIIAAIGVINILNWLKGQNWYLLKIGNWILLILVIWQFARYEHMYYKHMSIEYPFSSQYGLKELSSYISENEKNYENVIITTRYDQPYILFLFYNKYPPKKFQKNHVLTPRDKFGFSTVSSFDKFIFKPINWYKDRINYPNSMIVVTPEEILKESKIVKRIYGTNGYEYFDIVAN